MEACAGTGTDCRGEFASLTDARGGTVAGEHVPGGGAARCVAVGKVRARGDEGGNECDGEVAKVHGRGEKLMCCSSIATGGEGAVVQSMVEGVQGCCAGSEGGTKKRPSSRSQHLNSCSTHRDDKPEGMEK